MAGSLEAFGVAGVPEVRPGDDIAALIVAALAHADPAAPGMLLDGDIVVISSKIVSKAEGRVLAASSREPAIDGETLRVVAERRTPRGVTRIVASRSGPVLAAAGVDASNVEPGTVLLLPHDPDASARSLRARLHQLTGTTIAVLISDTAGRAWRDGQVDLAIGAAGLGVVDDLRGRTDDRGQLLEATVRALADELASVGDLVKGKSDGVPVAVVRGLGALVLEADGPGAASLLRSGQGDWFRYGHVEAVRAALGGRTGPQPLPIDDLDRRLRRALDVALEPGWGGWRVGPPTVTGAAGASDVASVDGAAHVVLHAPSGVDLGAALARLDAAAWSESLWLTFEGDDDHSAGVTAVGGPQPGR